jgi:hypothetical protein
MEAVVSERRCIGYPVQEEGPDMSRAVGIRFLNFDIGADLQPSPQLP